MRWYEKAAKNNHPDALALMGLLHMYGQMGFVLDLEKGRRCIELAKDADSVSFSMHMKTLSNLAEIYLAGVEDDKIDRALSILLPLVVECDLKGLPLPMIVRFMLGYTRYLEGDFLDSLRWYTSCALERDFSLQEKETLIHVAVFNSMSCCGQLQFPAQNKVWGGAVKKELMSPYVSYTYRSERVAALVQAQRLWRSMRDTCGGCGVAFEGKERKFCRGCKTFCYCSRECQKMHWNRKKNGHREDCKGAMELKRKLKEARRQSKAS